MAVIQQTTEKNKKTTQNHKAIKLRLAVLISIAAAVITIKLFGVRYQSNDDATLANIAAGAYGDRLHMVYVNILFAAVLRPLYFITNANWYVIVQILLEIISISIIIYILMDKLGVLAGSIISCGVMIAFSQPLFNSFQYTECAFIVLTAGLLLIIDNLGQTNKYCAAGILLALTGTLIRWDAFYAVGGLSASLLLYKFFRLDSQGKKKAVITMIILFAATFGAKAADILAYKADDGWNTFVEYNAARTAYSDYKVYDLPQENPFEDLGISDIDYKMLGYWNYYDEAKFTTELLEQISRGGQQIKLNKLIDKTVDRIKYMLHGESYRYMFRLITILSVLSLRPKWQSLLLVCIYGTYGAFMMYLVYRMRITSWVELGLIWTICVFSLYCIGESKISPRINIPAGIAIFVLAVYICLPVYKQLYIDRPYYEEFIQLEEPYFEAMTADKENIYLLVTQSISNVAGYDVSNPRPEGFFSNIVAYGGWLSRAPHRDEALARYGLQRPLVDAVDNPNVYIDYHYINEAAEYAKGQLGCEVYAVNTGKNPYAPYQLVTKLP